MIDFFHGTGTFFKDLGNPFQNVETLMIGLMLAVAVAGMAANGIFKPRRKPRDFPWE
ncbi:MAG: hypothetical protein NTX35_00975 [Verrucomicrobia bacterium]|nr:hypothetical protein [Verrucomicrobiota bacterium]